MITELEKHLDTARELRKCADSWVPDARLVGNVRADDIAALCKYFEDLHIAFKTTWDVLADPSTQISKRKR